MSGRSAIVRAKNTERADKSARKVYLENAHNLHEDHHFYSSASGSPSIPTVSTNPPSYVSHPSQRCHSVSSSGSNYPYSRNTRPIIVTSAIEKSEFRTHFDGMSSNLRDKIGRFLRGADEQPNSNRRRTDPANVSMDIHPRRIDVPPSIEAVPSLSPSTSPEASSFPPVVQQPPTISTRTKQQKLEAMIQRIRKFEGGGKLPELRWRSLKNNPQFWDDHGDTYVFMFRDGTRTKPPPSFRISSHLIHQLGSKIFIDKLLHTDEPAGWPKFFPYDHGTLRRMESQERLNRDEGYPNGPSSAPRSDTDSDSLHAFNGPQNVGSKPNNYIKYELYIPWPGPQSGIVSTIWHITTRNYFAIILDAGSLIGTTLYEAMSMLFERISMYPDYLDRSISPVAWITDFVSRHKLDDVRNNPSYAASLLAFSELPGIQWREGYIEAFVHCVGMLNIGLQTIPEWRHISPHTKMYLQNACLELEERVHQAQYWLASFDFTEMWPTSSAPPSSARGCFDRLRKWLCSYYEDALSHWPPTNRHTWLTHDLVTRLSDDFYGLYDYLVDRFLWFVGSNSRPGQELNWTITDGCAGSAFRADTPELPFTDILVGFDKRNGFEHMPFPYPKTPTSTPVHNKPKPSFRLKKPISPAEIQAQSRRKALSYSEASNVYLLRGRYMHTDLVTKFIEFEQSDIVDSLDPYEARLGRWILIYGILQVLAMVSVDSPNLRYKEGCLYHLSPQMKGVVPWAEPHSDPEEEAGPEGSHCFTISRTWKWHATDRRGSHQPVIWGQFGDSGRGLGMGAETGIPPQSPDRKPADNTSRKRAEDWVGSSDMDLRTDQDIDHQDKHPILPDLDALHDDQRNEYPSHNILTSLNTDLDDEIHAEEGSGSSGEYSTAESPLSTSGKSRVHIQGLDQKVPRGWEF